MYENITNDKMVTKPNHYQSETGLEVIDVIEAFTFDLHGIEATDTGNIIKYICRWKKKNGLQDLEKTMWYLQHLIDHVKKLEEENDIPPNNDSEKHSGRYPWDETNPWTKVETVFKDFNKTIIETLGEKKDIPSDIEDKNNSWTNYYMDSVTFEDVDVTFGMRSDAEHILDLVKNVIETYGVITVPDVYGLCNVSKSYHFDKALTDYGWDKSDVEKMKVTRIRRGYTLVFPRPHYLTDDEISAHDNPSLLSDIEFMLRSLAVKYGVRETKEAVYNFITNNNEKGE